MTPPSTSLRHSLRISIDDVRIGMFISELDRPWTSTPFLLQGFVLTDELDRQTLLGLVREIVIDPSRSVLDALAHLPRDLLYEEAIATSVKVISRRTPPTTPDATQRTANRKDSSLRLVLTVLARSVRALFAGASTTRPEAYYLRHTMLETAQTAHGKSADAKGERQTDAHSKADHKARLTPPSDPAFSAWIHQLYPRDVRFAPLNWVERWQNWRIEQNRKKPPRRGHNVRRRASKTTRPDYIPETVKLVIYEDVIPIQEELGHARKVIHRTDALLKKLELDIQQDQTIALEKIGPAVNLLTASVISNPGALMWLIRMRAENNAAYAHSLKVAIYMMVLGRHLGFHRQQLNELGYIGLLLDVGKLGLPAQLLEKPQRFSDDERKIMRTHVEGSVNILRATDPLAHNVMLGISEHHERLDGSGYPSGLSGNEISIFGRIAAIADSFAAMTSHRPYDITHSAFDAMRELFKQADSQLHAPLVEEFVQAIGIFPVGSMIELSTGEVAIVLEHNKIRRLEPKILLLTHDDKSLLGKPYVVDLMRQKKTPAATERKIMRGLPDGTYGLVCSDFYQA